MNKEAKAGLYLRAVRILLSIAASRLADKSRTAMPYEMRASEMRDLDRFAHFQAPRTDIGRQALRLARAELAKENTK